MKLQGQADILNLEDLQDKGNAIMPTVIVAEGDRLLRSALAIYLKGLGYSVLEADDALSLLNHLRQVPVEVVLLDTYLKLKGVDLLKYIRSQPEWAEVPVVAIVTSDDNAECLDYLAPGDYVRMPFDMASLNWVLQNLLTAA